jgi:hypothetical protein
MSYEPKKRTRQQHLVMFKYLRAKLERDLVEGRYTLHLKKPEMESLISACILAIESIDTNDKSNKTDPFAI